MFPQFCQKISGEDVFQLNDYEEYSPLKKEFNCSSSDTVHIVNTIREINLNCCGYVTGNIINFYTSGNNFHLMNPNKEYVFLCSKSECFDPSSPIPYHILLRFIQHKCGKLLLIYNDIYFLLIKTKDTYNVCKKLDEIFCLREFFNTIIISAICENTHDDVFLKLLELYSIKYEGKDVRKYDIFNLLIEVLKIEIK